MNNEIKYNNIFNKIKEAQNILLLTHEKPDIDAVSSVCAMIELLENINKPCLAYCNDAPPFQHNFIPHIEKIESDENKFNFANFDLIIIFDCGAISRTRLSEKIMNRNSRQLLVEIDHHVKIENHADIEIRDDKAASTTILVHDFLKANKLKINKNMANCILAGILTDSGNFIYAATTDLTIKISSEMLSLGANLPQIMDNTMRNKNLAALKVWGKAMAQTQINKKYNIAFTALTLKDTKGLNDEDLEGIPNFLGNIHNVKAVMIIREQDDGTIKGSLRSAHPKTNVSALAQSLGGGGHIKAAGFTIEGQLKQTNNSWKII